MPTIAPTITAETAEEFHHQMDKIKSFALRVHLDFSDGLFTPRKLLDPRHAWWPVGLKVDFHLMYKEPSSTIHKITAHKPNLVIVQAEADGDFMNLAKSLKQKGIKVGVALLPASSEEHIIPAINLIDHVLIFSGNLGHQGGSRANLELLEKIKELRKIKPELEIGWDGGINGQNVSQLILGGVDVLDVGGFIQSAISPAAAFHSLQRIADETGTT